MGTAGCGFIIGGFSAACNVLHDVVDWGDSREYPHSKAVQYLVWYVVLFGRG